MIELPIWVQLMVMYVALNVLATLIILRDKETASFLLDILPAWVVFPLLAVTLLPICLGTVVWLLIAEDRFFPSVVLWDDGESTRD